MTHLQSVDTLDMAEAEARAAEAQGFLFRPTGSQIVDPDDSPPIPFGLPEIDEALLGGLRLGVHVIAGFAHMGKTQLLLRLLHENRDKLIVVFTPDEDVNSFVNKALQVTTGAPLETLLYMPATQKRAMFKEHYSCLEIDDGFRGKGDLVQWLSEAEQWHSRKVDLVAFDYLGYLASSRGDDVSGSMIKAGNNAKQLSKETGVPWVVIHQANRGAADGSKPMTTRDVAYSGEQQATTLWGVRRMAFNPKATMQERQQELVAPTININLIKNKQTYKYLEGNHPGSEVQYVIDKDSGLVRPFKESERLATMNRVMRGVSNGYNGYQR